MLYYRLLLAAPMDSVHTGDKVERAWALWLAHKRITEFEQALQLTHTPGLTRLDAERIQTRTSTAAGALRLRLFEHMPTGRWTSTLTYVPVSGPAAVGLGISGWVELTVELDQSGLVEPQPIRFQPPRLAKYLLGVGEWADASRSLGEPVEIDFNHAAQLAAFIADPLRRLPAIVCSQPINSSDHVWRNVVAELARQTQGLATIWMLDGDANRRFAERVGEDLRVWGGAVRTYLPDLHGALEGVTDSRSVHKVLRWEMLRDTPELAARIIAASCRESLLQAKPWTPAPSALNTLTVDVAEVPSLVTDPSLLANRTFARTELAARAAELEEARRFIDALVAENEGLRAAQTDIARNAEMAFEVAAEYEAKWLAANAQLEVAADESEQLLDELNDAGRRERNLRLALQASHTPDAPAVVDPLADPETDYSPAPDTFEELLAYLELMPEVHFTGDPSGPDHLWQQADRKTILKKTWEAVLAMAAYSRAVRAGRFNGTFYNWCTSDDDPAVTRRLQPGRLASTESESVQRNEQMRRRRVLRVPADVDPAQEAEMFAHVKLGVGSTFPRMHYIEHDGVVYVGYIGPHLPNTKT